MGLYKGSGGGGRNGAKGKPRRGDAPYPPSTWQALMEPVRSNPALDPLDRVAAEMEAKWGPGRLPRLVSPELAQKFYSAKQKLDEAIRFHQRDEIAHKATVMIRGWQVLDAAATEAGHSPNPSSVWSVTKDGKVYRVCLDETDMLKVARESETPQNVVTVDELLTVWQAFNADTTAERVKLAFPGATVPRVKRPDPNDGLPF